MAKRYTETKLDDATPEDVAAFASRFLGIPTDGLTHDQIVAKVRTATETDMIFVAVPEEDTEQTGHPPLKVEDDTPAGGLQGGLGRGDPKVRIVLHAEEKDGVIVARHKEVGVNGVVWLLKRGEEIEIPYRVFLALDNADRDVITHDGEGNVITQRVKNTPYNIMHMPSKEEIAAWEARTGAQFVPS